MADRRTAEYRLTPAAQRDLDEIFDYTVREWGLQQAVSYTAVIEKACAKLAKAPDLAQDCGHIRAGYRRAIVNRHVIYFRAEDYGVAIVRILHLRMDAPRHL
ncbi:MAG: type II toxin-antitoxin system RelE/ParE family toxin [Rhodanobacteraceae bacterium]